MTNKFPISLLAILVLIPITFSFKYGGGISFDRIGGFDNRLWIASLPISMLFCLFASSKWANQIIGKKIFLTEWLEWLISAILIGSVIGIIVAKKVQMTGMPQLTRAVTPPRI